VTYPQYQQPQGYAPQAPYQQPPQGYAPQQPPQPSYPQQIPAAPQQPAYGGGQGVAPPMPTPSDGVQVGGTMSPKMRHLLGRTVIIEPKRVEETGVGDDGKPRYEAYFDLTVVDGGPLQYGDNQDRLKPENNRPNTREVETPYRFTGCSDNGFGFVQAVRTALDSNEAAKIGVVEQSTVGRRPYVLTMTSAHHDGSDRTDGRARFDAAMALWAKIWADRHAAPGAPRQLVSPEPRNLVAPPPAAAAQPQINYGAPAQPSYAPQPQQAYAATMPAGAYGMQGEAYGYPAAGYAGAGPASQSAPPNGAPFYGMQPTAPVAPVLPQGVEAWLATLPPEQAAQQRAAFLAQGAAPAGPGI
jgi:hypothetical protein